MPNQTLSHPDLVTVPRDDVLRAIARRSFCVLGTASATGRPHSAGVLYAADGTTLYASTLRSSRKARNVAENPRAFVSIPIRRLPVGPPSSVQFAATAELLDVDAPEIRHLVDQGTLRAITSHGELDEPDGCFLRITASGPLHTFGLGMSLRRLMRDPLHAAGRADTH